MAKTGGYKSKLWEEVKSLSEERVRAVADFAAYLREREAWEATAEILGDDELVQEVKESRKAWAEGRKEEFVSLEELKTKLSV
jgi:tyrosyl-tRNA synthetase